MHLVSVRAVHFAPAPDIRAARGYFAALRDASWVSRLRPVALAVLSARPGLPAESMGLRVFPAGVMALRVCPVRVLVWASHSPVACHRSEVFRHLADLLASRPPAVFHLRAADTLLAAFPLKVADTHLAVYLLVAGKVACSPAAEDANPEEAVAAGAVEDNKVAGTQDEIPDSSRPTSKDFRNKENPRNRPRGCSNSYSSCNNSGNSSY
jgi:hypothetical protein